MSRTNIRYLEIDPTAAGDATVTAPTGDTQSDNDIINGHSAQPYALLEHNSFVLDGSRVFMPPTDAVAWWDDELSGSNGTIANPPTFVITFSQTHSTVGVTLEFDSVLNEWCNEINIKWYNGSTLLANVNFAPTSPQFYCAQTVNSFNKMELTLNKTDKPYRRAKLNRIIFGVYRDFGMEQIQTAKITAQCHLVSSELPISKFSWTLIDDGQIDTMFQYKQEVEVTTGDDLLGVYYINESKRKASELYDVECIDAIGILDTSNYAGAAYLTDTSAMAMFNAVIDGEFTVTYEAADANLKGIVPAGSKRKALQQILFAWGAVAATDGVRGIRVFTLPSTATVKPATEIYTAGTLEKSPLVTQINLTTHSYAQDANGSIEINGVKYKDTTGKYTWNNPNVDASERANVINVTDAMLINSGNAATVAARLGDYYEMRDTSKTKMVWDGERLGDKLTLDNPWGSPHTGFVKSMAMTISNVVAAQTEATG